MQHLLEARQLSKRFDAFQAVDNVSFSVQPGEIFGLLGPNGAGKTTTLRMLAGLLKPSDGEAFIAGNSMQLAQMQARKKMGFLTGDMDLYRRLNPKELLLYFGNLFETPANELESRVNSLIASFGISPFQDKHCEKLSTGQKQRVSIARTLVHNPDVVILDEPTTGLDIMSAEFILQFMHKMAKEEGKALIFSTHNLAEVERLCDRIGIINKGKLVFSGTPQELVQSSGKASLYEAFFDTVGAA